MLAGEVDPLAAHQGFDDRQPLASIGIALVVFEKRNAGIDNLAPVPGIHQVDREAALADVLDLQRHLGQHDRIIKHRFDRRDDLDTAGESRQCRRRGPGFKLVEVVAVRIGGVLGDQRAVIAERFGFQHEAPVAIP